MSRETLSQEPAVAEPPLATPPRLPVLAAIVVGVLGIGGAIAIGEIIAVFVGPTSAPLLAVDEQIVTLSSGRFKEFAVNTLGLGTSDKTVLMVSVGMALLIFGVVAGLISRRRAMPGVVLAVLLGVIGVYVVLQRNDLGQLGVLSPVGSLVGGVLTFRWLHRLALAAAVANVEGSGWEADEGRRRFLVTSAGVAVGAGIVGLGGHALSRKSDAQQSIDQIGTLTPADPAPKLPAGADFAADGTPAYLTDNANFYRIDTALTVPQVSAQSWSLKIHGMVDKEVSFTYDDIRKRKLIERPVTLTCVSDPVGGAYISTSNFIGVPLRDLLMEAGVKPGAAAAVLHQRGRVHRRHPGGRAARPGPGRDARHRHEPASRCRSSTASRPGWWCPASTGTCRRPSGLSTWS